MRRGAALIAAALLLLAACSDPGESLSFCEAVDQLVSTQVEAGPALRGDAPDADDVAQAFERVRNAAANVEAAAPAEIQDDLGVLIGSIEEGLTELADADPSDPLAFVSIFLERTPAEAERLGRATVAVSEVTEVECDVVLAPEAPDIDIDVPDVPEVDVTPPTPPTPPSVPEISVPDPPP